MRILFFTVQIAKDQLAHHTGYWKSKQAARSIADFRQRLWKQGFLMNTVYPIRTEYDILYDTLTYFK